MPSTTFLNLPEEKREKLLRAAAREFSQRPYNEASINQIVKEAGIARGSFYMYFRDKEELFCYVMRQHLGMLTQVIGDFLEKTQGDVFPALMKLFDFVHSADSPTLGEAGELAAILHQNRGMQRSGVLELLDPHEFLEQLAARVDIKKLDASSPAEVRQLLSLLLSVTMPILYRGRGTTRESRAHLEQTLEILKRGMEAKAPTAEKESSYGRTEG